jgi:hypothetical protein
MSVDLEELPAKPGALASARPDPDLAAAGFAETEYVAAGTATSYAAKDMPADGRFVLIPDATAGFRTRAVLRRPVDPADFSGTLVVEWLNVSSGMDGCPDWTFTNEEILRRGHAWAGVSAQMAGVEGGISSVQVEGLDLPGLKGSDPDRYGTLDHPGDAFGYDMYTQVAGALADVVGAGTVLAVGESQSAALLTTYVNGVHSLVGRFDGFLLHSRLAVAAPTGPIGDGLRMDDVVRNGEPVRIRDDQSAPVLIVQTEGDLFDRIGYLPARQPDAERVRTWEIAGAAHADKHLIDEVEPLLGCEVPVNRGQQSFVLKAALRHLDAWARGGAAPPAAVRLVIEGDDFGRDEDGNVRGGVRTPVVEAPVEVLSGRPWPGASVACRLFGSTVPLPAERLRERYADRAAYLAAYERAADAAIDAGFVLAEDREALLADARPELIPVSK